VLYSALSGLAVLGGGAIFSLMSEKYPDSLAPAAIGYSEVFGIMASFAAPWSMGAVIQASGGSFTAAFVLFALVEAAFLVLLMILARDTVSQPSIVGTPAE
jgi:nitrate/nitrite transporter NarK